MGMRRWSRGGVVGQWRPGHANAGACEHAAWHRPMSRRVSHPLGTQCPRSPASDHRSKRGLCVRVRAYDNGGRRDAVWCDVAHRARFGVQPFQVARFE
jgi:hypothetical protein